MKKHEVCPRQPAGKTEVGKRIKMAITVDFELHDRLQELYQQGYSISHLIDSAVWIIWEGPNLASSWERRK
ncbi:MAG: hypothetical protein NTY51_08050 [Deltaproteobacteria bacterium]|nr:hypothetical protein [Deltaproteobacteria bacterium]